MKIGSVCPVRMVEEMTDSFDGVEHQPVEDAQGPVYLDVKGIPMLGSEVVVLGVCKLCGAVYGWHLK